MAEEKQIELQILNFLKTVGIFVFKIDRQGTYDSVKKVFRSNKNPHKIKGVSDIIGIVGGRFLAIEVKAEKGYLTPEQRLFLVKVNEEGGIGFVARSLDQCINQLLPHLPKDSYLHKISKSIKQDDERFS